MCHLGRPLYAIFGYHFSEQLTSHLEQVRVHLRRRGGQVQKRNGAYGPWLAKAKLPDGSRTALEKNQPGFSSLPLSALRAQLQHGPDSRRYSPHASGKTHGVVPHNDYRMRYINHPYRVRTASSRSCVRGNERIAVESSASPSKSFRPQLCRSWVPWGARCGTSNHASMWRRAVGVVRPEMGFH